MSLRGAFSVQLSGSPLGPLHLELTSRMDSVLHGVQKSRLGEVKKRCACLLKLTVYL